jgi:outer membrane receptor protein involved in Fe transport
MRLDADIDNLGNRKYDLPVPGMGRTFYGGLSFQF